MMIQSIGLLITAGVISLAPVAAANTELVTNTVSFKHDFQGPFPETELENWSITHDVELTYESTTGQWTNDSWELNSRSSRAARRSPSTAATRVSYTTASASTSRSVSRRHPSTTVP